jgi:hypothetical protein
MKRDDDTDRTEVATEDAGRRVNTPPPPPADGHDARSDGEILQMYE